MSIPNQNDSPKLAPSSPFLSSAGDSSPSSRQPCSPSVSAAQHCATGDHHLKAVSSDACPAALLELELKSNLRQLLEGVETIANHEMELLQSRRDLLLRRQNLIASKAAYSLRDWRDLLLICLLQKRALVRDLSVASIPNTVPLDPIFRAKSILLLNAKDYLARRKWRQIWMAYKAHAEGKKVLARIKAIDAIYTEQHVQYQELLDMQTLFLQPLTLMADAGFVQRQDVTNAFHVAAITTLHQVLKALLEQERNNWPRARYARCISTKASLMQEFYCAYASDTNVMLQSLRRLLSKPEISQFFAETFSEHPSHFADSAESAHSSNLESKIQKLLERPLGHVSRMLAALKSCLPHLPPDHCLHADTIESIEVLHHVHQETLRIKQDATLALIAFDATISTSCTHLFFCNTGTSIKKLGDVEFLVEKSVRCVFGTKPSMHQNLIVNNRASSGRHGSPSRCCCAMAC